jgi:GT2 family glycosyltransferase
MDPPRVTTVVATNDRRADLERSLPHHAGPLIVLDNGSTDGTADAVRTRAPAADLVVLDRNLGAPARNIGVRRARTPYVAFADDDSWWAPGALDRAADLLDAHPHVGLVAGRVLVGEDHRPDPVCARMEAAPLGRALDLPGPSVLGFLACGAVVRRDAFLATGGFDDVVFFCGEEERVALDLAAAGWALVYAGDVVAHHHPCADRDPDRRQALAARNRVLTALMRRQWPVVSHRMADAARAGRPGRAGLRAALRRLPRALAHRRLVPPDVEWSAERLEAASGPAVATA